MTPPDGGSLEDPAQLYSKAVPAVTIGHSAGITWDGRVLIFGHEPGGGAQARCQATSSITDRSLFFFDARSGADLGSFVMPRVQTATENCTWHNYNVVPTDKRYVLVSAGYQSGISVVDFTDPANAREVGFADPAPLSETQLILGGDWSTRRPRSSRSTERRDSRWADAPPTAPRSTRRAGPQPQQLEVHRVGTSQRPPQVKPQRSKTLTSRESWCGSAPCGLAAALRSIADPQAW